MVAQPNLTTQSKVVIDGIGPIRVGMTIAEAENAAQVSLVEKGGRAGLGSCYYLWPKTGPSNLGLMVTSNREGKGVDRQHDQIARVDILAGSRISTLSGAKIGATEARIKSLYVKQIKVTPGTYSWRQGGHDLTFIPRDLEDKNYRLVFETLKGRVTQFRAGRLPEVTYVEGCA